MKEATNNKIYVLHDKHLDEEQDFAHNVTHLVGIVGLVEVWGYIQSAHNRPDSI